MSRLSVVPDKTGDQAFRTRRRRYAIAAIAVLIASGIVTFYVAEGRSSSSSSSCYAVPAVPEAVPCVAGYNFTVTVNYTGPWRLSYQGYNVSKLTVNGTYTGTGFNSTTLLVKGSANGWKLCAKAQKLDASNFTLGLSIGAENSTSLPFGSTTVCESTTYV